MLLETASSGNSSSYPGGSIFSPKTSIICQIMQEILSLIGCRHASQLDMQKNKSIQKTKAASKNPVTIVASRCGLVPPCRSGVDCCDLPLRFIIWIYYLDLLPGSVTRICSMSANPANIPLHKARSTLIALFTVLDRSIQ